MNVVAQGQVLHLLQAHWGLDVMEKASAMLGAAERIWENLTSVPLEYRYVSEVIAFSNGRGLTTFHPIIGIANIIALPEGVTLEYQKIQSFGLIILAYPYNGEAVVEYYAGFEATIPDDIALALAHLAVWLVNADIVDSIQSEVRVDFNQLPPVTRQVIAAWRG
jgi:hypothetical protein